MRLQAKNGGDGNISGASAGVVARRGDAAVPLDLGAAGIVGRGLDLEALEGIAVDVGHVVGDLAVVDGEGEDGLGLGFGKAVRVAGDDEGVGGLALLWVAVGEDATGLEDFAGRDGAASSVDGNVKVALVPDGSPARGNAGGAGQADHGEEADLHVESCWGFG